MCSWVILCIIFLFLGMLKSVYVFKSAELQVLVKYYLFIFSSLLTKSTHSNNFLSNYSRPGTN